MDEPKINLRAWEPIEKRKKKSQSAVSDRQIKYQLNNNATNNSSQNNSKQNNMVKVQASKIEDEVNDKIKKDEIYFDGNIESKVKAPNYYEYKINSDKKQSKFNIEIDDKIYKKPKKKIKKLNFRPNSILNLNIIKTLTAALGAVLTGMVFGYLILNYFVQPMFNDSASLNTNSQNNTNNIITNENNNQITNSQSTIPEQTIYLIQAGVFTELAGAESIVTEQKNLGRSAVITGSGPYFVYVGMGTTKDNAIKIKDTLTQGSDFYVKEYIIPEYQANVSESTFKALSEFFTSGDELAEALSSSVSITLVDKNTEINYEEILRMHQRFLLEAQELRAILESDNLVSEQDVINQLINEMDYAIKALNSYKKSSNPQYLWSIQENLIKYKLKYGELTKI